MSQYNKMSAIEIVTRKTRGICSMRNVVNETLDDLNTTIVIVVSKYLKHCIISLSLLDIKHEFCTVSGFQCGLSKHLTLLPGHKCVEQR